MKKLYLCSLVAFLLAGDLAVVPAAAQNTSNDRFETSVQEIEQQIGSWEHQANLQIAFVVAVVVFGALISAFQGSRQPWSKIATLILGIATSIFTGINAKVFSADYRSLQRAAIEGHAIVRKLHGMIAVFGQAQPQGDDLGKFNAEFLQVVEDFNEISKTLEGTATMQTTPAGRIAAALSLRVVHAQAESASPEWVQQLPSDKRSFYFLGKGRDASLTTAKTNSLQDAIRTASSALTPGEPYSAERSVSTPIKDAAVVQDTFFTYDKPSASYTYYTLLRISREIQNFRPTLTVYHQGHWRPVDLTFDPTAGLFVFDDNGVASKVRIDQQGIHVETLFALKASDRPASLTATTEFVFASSNNSLGCTVYQFSLAKKITSQRLLAVGGGGCDGIAADGNSVFLVIPGKKQIWSWSNWTSPSPNIWSFREIERGGVLNFDRSGRRLLYADASGTAYAISIPQGTIGPVAANVGTVHSIATDPNHILLASGKKVLFYSRTENRGENPPSSLQSLRGGLITGVAVDTTDRAWIADFDNGLLTGPFPLN